MPYPPPVDLLEVKRNGVVRSLVFRRVAGGLLAVWGMAALALEVWPWDQSLHEAQAEAPSRWRLASPTLAPLRGLLARLHDDLPTDALVVVHSRSWIGGEEFFLVTWVAYELPRQRVLSPEQLRPALDQALTSGSLPPVYQLTVPASAPLRSRYLGLREHAWLRVESHPSARLFELVRRGTPGSRP